MTHSRRTTTVSPLLTAEPIQGGCDVMCFHPTHDLSLDDILSTIKEGKSIYHRRGSQDGIAHVQIFGESVSYSARTLADQRSRTRVRRWAIRIRIRTAKCGRPRSCLRSPPRSSRISVLTPTATAMTNGAKGCQNKPCLLCECITYERTAGERMVVENDHFMALVPWWAYWPFQVLGKMVGRDVFRELTMLA